MKITTLLFLFGLAVTLSLAQSADEYDYEDEQSAAPPPPPPPKPALRGLVASRQARGPIIGRPTPKALQATQKTTTTTTEEPPAYDEEEPLDEELEADPTTTTEAPKKGGITLGRVRPFRSQESLIEALKRRRQQQGTGGHAPSTTTTPPPPTEKSSKPGRKSKAFSDQTGSDSQNKNTVGRRFNPRGKVTKTETPVVEEVEEEEPQPVRARSFGGRGRRF